MTIEVDKQLNKFYLISEEIIPRAFKKTVEVKELINDDPNLKISDAVKQVGISRSAYYKYKDHIFPFYNPDQSTLHLNLELSEETYALSELFSELSRANAKVLTVNQNIPEEQRMYISVILDVTLMQMDIEQLLKRINQLDNVLTVKALPQNMVCRKENDDLH